MFGIKCLKMINFDRDQLTDRRRQAECDIKVSIRVAVLSLQYNFCATSYKYIPPPHIFEIN